MFLLSITFISLSANATANLPTGIEQSMQSDNESDCGCWEKYIERIDAGTELSRLSDRRDLLIDSVDYRLDLPENSDVAKEVKWLIKEIEKLEKKKKAKEIQYHKCWAKKND